MKMSRFIGQVLKSRREKRDMEAQGFTKLDLLGRGLLGCPPWPPWRVSEVIIGVDGTSLWLKCAPDCRHVQHADMMECQTCWLKWDTNDPSPPECPYAKDMAKWGKAR